MYEELIKKINPKPKFNLNWYSGSDSYSDGPIEDITLDIIANNEPENYSYALAERFSWATYYHLTPLRHNIINWYPFNPEASVLEIGCGMGAITNTLCEKCQSVTSVELSSRRATATLLRCRKHSNLEIIVGNLNDIEFSEKFDYITLIGVLEYQEYFTETDTPYKDFLTKIKSLLKPDGKLLIAIENKYGLKYWCGAKEDHTGVVYDGINDYRYTKGGVKTFSRSDLKKLISDSGFNYSYFYYPMPDYKLPTVIYSEDVLPKDSDMENYVPYYIPDNSTLIGNEKLIYQDVIENGAFEFMANSFLVECSDNEDIGQITFSCASSERFEEFRVITSFSKDGCVMKQSATPKGISHIDSVHGYYNMLSKTGVSVVEEKLSDGKVITDFCDKERIDRLILRTLKNSPRDVGVALEIADMVYDDILKSSIPSGEGVNLLYTLNIDTKDSGINYGVVLKNGFVDMIFKNAFYDGDRLIWFDQEWVLNDVPAGFVMYRAITELIYTYPVLNNYIPLDGLYKRYGIEPKCIENYEKLNLFFIKSLVDELAMKENNIVRGIDDETIKTNIFKLSQPH